MSSFRELLSFVVTADASQAIKEFDKLEKSSATAMAKTEGTTAATAANFIRIGAGATAFAAVAGVGIFKAATAAADLDKAMSRIDAAFGSSASQVKEFAKGAQFLSDIDAAQFSADIGEAAKGLGVTADEAAKLTPQVVDVASKLSVIKGLDMGTALESISAALRGEYDATQRLVPALSAKRIVDEALIATGKEKESQLTTAEKAQAALNIVIEDGTKIIEGNSKALESQSAKMTETKARLQDAFTAFGAGALPVVQGVTTAVAGIASAFEKIPAPVSQVGGSIAAVAAGLAGVSGLVNLSIGGFMKLRDGWSSLNTKIAEGEGILGKYHGAVGRATQVAGIVGAAFAVEEVGRAWNDAQHSALIYDTAVKKITSARTAEEAVAGFAKEAANAEGPLDSLGDGMALFVSQLSGGVVDLNDYTLQLGKYRVEVNDAKEAIDGMMDKDPTAALKAINSMLELMPKGDLGAAGESFKKFLTDSKSALEENAAAGETNADAIGGVTDAAGESADAMARQKAETDQATQAMKDYQDQVSALDTVGAFFDSFKGIADANQGVKDSFVDILDAQNKLNEARKSGKPDEIAAAERDLAAAQRDGVQATDEVTGAWEKFAQAQDKLLQGGSQGIAEAQQRLDDWVKRGAVPPDIAKGLQAEIDRAKAVVENSPPPQLKPATVPAPNTAPFDTGIASSREKIEQLEKGPHVATLDANPKPADDKVALTTGAFNEFGRLRPSAILNATDNATPIAHGAKKAAEDFEGAYDATFNIRTVGEQEARQHIQEIKDAIARQSVPGSSAPAAGPAPAPVTNVVINMPAGINGRDVERTMRRFAAQNGSRGRARVPA